MEIVTAAERLSSDEFSTPKQGLCALNARFKPDFHGSPTIDFSTPYLEGCEYARADNPADMTESPVLQRESNLYQHPSLLLNDQPSFRKSHDLYALGCLLLKMGLLTPFLTCLTHSVRKVTGRLPSSALSYAGKKEMMEVNKSKETPLETCDEGSVNEAARIDARDVFAPLVRSCSTAGDRVNRRYGKAADLNEDDEDSENKDAKCLNLEVDIIERSKGCRVQRYWSSTYRSTQK